jgi:hypothetical protein
VTFTVLVVKKETEPQNQEETNGQTKEKRFIVLNEIKTL